MFHPVLASTMGLFELLVALALMGSVVLALAVWLLREGSTEAAWRRFAARRGFAFQGIGLATPLAIHGRVRGIDVSLTFESQGLPPERPVEMGVRATACFALPMPRGLQVVEDRRFPLGPARQEGPDIAVGVADLDRRCVVQGRQEDEVRALFASAEVAQAVLQFLVDGNGRAVVSEHGVSVFRQEVLSKPGELEALLERVVAVVERIESALHLSPEDAPRTLDGPPDRARLPWDWQPPGGLPARRRRRRAPDRLRTATSLSSPAAAPGLSREASPSTGAPPG
jgi:hypothetical protein